MPDAVLEITLLVTKFGIPKGVNAYTNLWGSIKFLWIGEDGVPEESCHTKGRKLFHLRQHTRNLYEVKKATPTQDKISIFSKPIIFEAAELNDYSGLRNPLNTARAAFLNL